MGSGSALQLRRASCLGQLVVRGVWCEACVCSQLTLAAPPAAASAQELCRELGRGGFNELIHQMGFDLLIHQMGCAGPSLRMIDSPRNLAGAESG